MESHTIYQIYQVYERIGHEKVLSTERYWEGKSQTLSLPGFKKGEKEVRYQELNLTFPC